MEFITKFGMHRVIEPKMIHPQPAWKIDNNMEIYDNEVLLEVKIININSSSFRQICTEYNNDVNKIKETILKIVELRGKLHNPITNTGGILLGVVKKIGKNYDNKANIKEGDYVIPLVSLSLIPLKIDKIRSIDIASAQLHVEGQAILFSSNHLIKVEGDINPELLLILVDEAGSCLQSYLSSKENDNILIMGANGKVGLLSAFAVREKIGNKGKLVGIVYTDSSKKALQKYDVFDEIYVCDTTNPEEAYKTIMRYGDKLFDFTINCVHTFGTETFSILSTKDKGTIYFSNLTANYNSACLIAEGIGRDINIIPYRGYVEGHADFVIKLYKKHKDLRELIDKWLNKKVSRQIKNEEKAITQFSKNQIKEINLQEYVFMSDEIKKVLCNTVKVANYECNVLITGESGVGKEIFADIIYKLSKRNQGPYVKINCGSIPENLLESELFGYEKGAFTGASREGKLGFFEIANGGTLFLDEIGELPLSLQAKFLRVLQEKEIYRLGGVQPIKVDVRIIAATNRDLADMVMNGKFRKDLYYRLNVFHLYVPPLRERKDDILPLAKYFIDKYNKKYYMNKHFEESALLYLLEYPWYGNIRELDNLIQRLLISSDHNTISVMDVINNLDNKEFLDKNNNLSLKEELEKMEYNILMNAKMQYITTRKMAKALGISQPTLVRKLKKYNL